MHAGIGKMHAGIGKQNVSRRPGLQQHRLFAGLLLSRLPKSDTGATAVLVDELDAAFLQGRSYHLCGRLASSQLAVDRFQTSYCGLRNT